MSPDLFVPAIITTTTTTTTEATNQTDQTRPGKSLNTEKEKVKRSPKTVGPLHNKSTNP